MDVAIHSSPTPPPDGYWFADSSSISFSDSSLRSPSSSPPSEAKIRSSKPTWRFLVTSSLISSSAMQFRCASIRLFLPLLIFSYFFSFPGSKIRAFFRVLIRTQKLLIFPKNESYYLEASYPVQPAHVSSLVIFQVCEIEESHAHDYCLLKTIIPQKLFAPATDENKSLEVPLSCL